MKKVVFIVSAFLIALVALFSACNVTRVVTNESVVIQNGDTSVVIQTKVVEVYDASKKE